MTADGTYRPARAGETITTAAERVASVVTGHQDRGTTGDWDDAAGKLRRCSCGWSQTYPGRTDHGRGLWMDHIVALLLAAARPDAPQPATTDDAVERAARAIWMRQWEHPEMHSWERLPEDEKGPYRADARAALATAGAGAEVDREAAWREYATVERLNLDWRRSSHGHAFMAGAALAARGDAATPTEVEWGVREEERTTASYSREDAEDWINDEEAWNPGETRTLVQRTVSAWREVS